MLSFEVGWDGARASLGSLLRYSGQVSLLYFSGEGGIKR